MEKGLFTALFILIAAFCMAQSQDDLKKIESARIGLISERLGLTPEQAQQFWPLYNEYNDKRRELRKELSDARRDIDVNNATEQEKRQLIENGLKIKERELALEKDYSERLLRVISSQQMLKLRRAEDDFRDMLLKRLQNQRMQGRNEDQMRDKVQERMQRRRTN